MATTTLVGRGHIETRGQSPHREMLHYFVTLPVLGQYQTSCTVGWQPFYCVHKSNQTSKPPGGPHQMTSLLPTKQHCSCCIMWVDTEWIGSGIRTSHLVSINIWQQASGSWYTKQCLPLTSEMGQEIL